jgi:tetratricopeptide (TPR) repeat protein
LVRQSHGETYVFNHALTQQTLFAELSPLRRRRLHLAAGRALERLPDRERERRAGELAWHFLEADDAPQALRFSMLAGQQAGQVFAHQEAERQYQTALDLARDLGDTAQEAQALDCLAAVLVVRARYNRALAMLEDAATLYRGRGRPEDEARSVAQMARVHVIQNTSREGIARLRPLIDEMEEAGGASFGLASLWAAIAELYSDIAEYENQLAAADRALHLVAPDDADSAHQRLRLAAEVTRYDALMRQGETDVAMQVMEHLIPRAEASGDLDTLARALGTAATYYARRGQFDKDRFYLERMLAVAERRDDHGQIILALMGLSTNAFDLGEWSAAETYLTRADDIIRPLGDSRVAIWPLAACAWLSLRRGDLAAVERQAQAVLDLLGGSGDAPWRRNILRILAESALLSGNPQQAATYLEQAQQEMGWERDPGFLYTLAWARLAMGQADEARTLSERAVAQARRKERPPDIISALTVHGAVTGALGEVEQADSLLHEALEISRSVPLPFEEARAQYEAGILEAARGNRDSAQQHLADALAIFERLGAQADRDRVRAAIGNLETT